ncbi:phage tail length tape measure family protein [Microbulbifer sp. 2304DJ12-6]|uniref:phage tail length tape measure family protein n=1 Tax=Microbulbifer sp. 2304DJ12-6 TaxID=3233340 RepID=UPI0039B06948
MTRQASMATMVANLELRSTQYKREMVQVSARNKALARDIKNTATSGDIFSRSMRGAAQGVASIDGPLGGVSGRVGALNGFLHSGAGAWALFGAGVAGVTAVLYKSIRAGEEMERQQLKIEALLKATGGVSGRTAQQLDEQARSVARATLASVRGIRDAQGVLLTFRTVQGETFDRAIALSQDLAAVMGGDAKSAALQLGKALEEPSVGLTMLRRSGVSFTEAEKAQIKAMTEAGRVAEAQRLILDKLARQVGGAGAGEAGGLTGAVDSLGQSWQEFLEKFNQTTGATGLATRAIQGLAGSLDDSRGVAEDTEAAVTALAILLGGRFAGAIGRQATQMALLNTNTYKATVQTNALGQVIGRTTITTRAAAVAATGLKNAFAFLGGPVGVITIAVASLVAWNAAQPTTEQKAESLTGRIDELTRSWKELTKAQRINREQKVLVDRDDLAVQLAQLKKQRDFLRDGGLKEGSRFGYQAPLGNDHSRVRELNDQIDTLKQNIDSANQKLANLGKPDQQRFREEAEAAFKAALEREAVERARAENALQQAQETGAAQLAQLDSFLADQRGKIDLDHETRLQQIAALQIAEEELRRRGFDSIETLREEYTAREAARYQAALQALQAGPDGGGANQPGPDGLTDTERQHIAARLQTLQLSWLTEMEQLQVQQDEEMALLDQAYASKLIQRDEYERSLFQLEQKHTKAREKLEQVSSKNRWKAFSGAMDMMLGVSNTGSKKLFKIQKTLSLAKAVATLPSAVIESFNNSGGYPWGIPAAVAMAAAGAAQIAQIKSTNFSGGGTAASVSGGGATTLPSSTGATAARLDTFASNDAPQQPRTQVIIQIQGDVVGDSSERFIEDLRTGISSGDLVIIDKNSRQAQELRD